MAITQIKQNLAKTLHATVHCSLTALSGVTWIMVDVKNFIVSPPVSTLPFGIKVSAFGFFANGLESDSTETDSWRSLKTNRNFFGN